MSDQKSEFIRFLLKNDVLLLGKKILKSGRESPYFIKLDAVDNGPAMVALGDAYARTILDHLKPEEFDGIVGIPDKAHIFGPLIAASLANKGIKKNYSSWRKEAKTHGDATPTDSDTYDQRQKEFILGAKILKGSKQIVVDDVMTSGGAKKEALDLLKYLAPEVNIPAIVISANRQEVDESGEDAVTEFMEKEKVPVLFAITASDIFDEIKKSGKISEEQEKDFLRYFRAWGTPKLRNKYDLSSKMLLEGRNLVPACDMPSKEKLETVVKETAKNPKVSAYKIGFVLSLMYGLPKIVDTIKNIAPDKKVIYDHQKGGTDISDVAMARKYAQILKQAGVDAGIIFPLTGPNTQTAWTGELLQAGIEVIVGGRMTHPKFIELDGGYIANISPERIYKKAAIHGIANFVVPGNAPELVTLYRGLIEKYLEGKKPMLFAPGFLTQGGDISKTGEAAGPNFSAIVGRDLIDATDIAKKAEELTAKL